MVIVGILITASIVACPAYLRADEQVATLPGEWQVVNPHLPKRLEFAEILNGELIYNQAMHPRVDKDRNMRWRNTTEDFWLMCSYRDSDVKIYRRVEGEHSCEFLKRGSGPGNPSSMICTPIKT